MFQSLNTCLQQAKKIIAFHHLPSFLTGRLCSKLVPYNRYQPPQCKGQMWHPVYPIKSSKSSQHLRPRAFHSCPPCLVMSYTRIPRSPSKLKRKGSFNSQHMPAPLNIPKQRTKLTCQCTKKPFRHLVRACQSHPKNDLKTLPGPRPSSSTASTVAPAEISRSTTAARPNRAA